MGNCSRLLKKFLRRKFFFARIIIVRQTKSFRPLGGTIFRFKKRSKRMFSVGEFIVYGTTGVCRIEEIYKKAYRTCDCREWIKIIKTLYLRKMSRIAEGKKVTVMDGRYLNMAEEKLYTELSLALEMDKERVIEYITEHVEQSKENIAE